MVTWYGVLVALHILLSIAWLGVDVGVFVGSHLIRNRRYDPGARFLVSRLMGYLDLSPRLAVPLVFADGLNLAVVGGWSPLPNWLVILTWALALAWCALIVAAFVLQHRAEMGHALGDRQQAWLQGYRRVDLWARWAWLAALALGIGGALASDGAFRGLWLNLKVALFGLVLLVGNVLRIIPGTSAMALMSEIYHQGSTTEREDALYRRLRITHPIILTMYGCVVLAIFLGVVKPGA